MKKNFFYKKHMGIDLNVRNNGIKRLNRVYSDIGSFNNYVTVKSSTHYFDPPTLLRNAHCDR